MSLQTGQILDGKYRIIRELGSGAMGAVYEGENVRIHRRVAIKVLLPAVAQNKGAVQRFEREAQAAGRIGSEHIVEVLDLGTMADGGFYMVMEFLEGQTLGERIRSRGRLAPREISPIVQQLLSGLEMAHDARIIHRDLKPDNVFLMREYSGQRDFVKILDFGVSKFNPLNVEEGMSMTRTGAVVGTPFYMAPEQAKGAKDIDARSDLYSVGVILYEAVTGQKPFHAGTFNELIFKIVLEQPPVPETFVPNLDPAFSRIIRRAMAREVEDRFASASEFRDTLSLWLHTGRDTKDGQPVPPPLDGLDWEDDNPTAVGSNKSGASGTVMMDDGAEVLATQLIEPEASTRIVEPSRKPPPSRRAPPRKSKSAKTEPLEQMSAPLGAGSAQPPLAAALSPPPMDAPVIMMPRPPAVPNVSGYPQGAAIGGAIAPNAPTPVPPVMHEEEPWPVAGVPQRKKGGALAIVAGVLLAVGLGATAGIMYLRTAPESDSSQQAAQADAPEQDEASAEPAASADAEPAASAGEVEDQPAAASDDSDDDEEPQESGDRVAANDATPKPEAAPAPRPQPMAKAAPSPRPQPVSAPSPRPAPHPAPAPSPAPATTAKIKTGGRTINTEL